MLRYLSAVEVAAAMPPLAERLRLADRAMLALGRDADLPPRIEVHPGQEGSPAQAMPAMLRGDAPDGSMDLIGARWTTGPAAHSEAGLPACQALVLLSDPRTGEPLAVMDGAALTAPRTAAISGSVIRHFAAGGTTRGTTAGGTTGGGEPAGRTARSGQPVRLAVLGAGAQARSHLPVIGHLLPGADVRVTDNDGARAVALAREASAIDGLGSVRAVAGVREAVESADVVVSVWASGPTRQALDPAWLGPATLFVAVDRDMQAPAALAREAFFVVDDRDEFLAARSGPVFAGYPDPDATIGELLRAAASPAVGGCPATGGAGSPAAGAAKAEPTPRSGRVLVTLLGAGLADVIFAAAILARAEKLGLGRLLPR
jgi:ornithine cyclodeaminase/alanine dehydrogenase-like protein (mu-crystallin family)